MDVATFTIRAGVVRALLASLHALGVSGPAVLQSSGVDPALLEEPEGRVPEPVLLAVWMAAEQLWGREQLGLRAGAALPIGALGVLEYLAVTAPTIGEAIRRMSEHSAVVGTGMTFTIADGGHGDVIVAMDHPFALDFLPPSFVEYVWTLVVARFRDRIDARFRPRVLLRHGPIGPRETYHAVLGDVVFHAARSEMHVPRAQWELRNPHADPALSGVLEAHARGTVANLPTRPIDRIRSALADGLRAGDASVERTAERLGVSGRTLQRELASANTSYTRARDEVRMELARSYLASRSMPLSEVTYRLGYSEPSAFHRAFRRWSGMTPLQYRRTVEAQHSDRTALHR